MKMKNGKSYKTITDAAAELHVSVDTIRRYVRNGFLPRPPRIFFGKVGVPIFSDEYLVQALAKLQDVQK